MPTDWPCRMGKPGHLQSSTTTPFSPRSPRTRRTVSYSAACPMPDLSDSCSWASISWSSRRSLPNSRRRAATWTGPALQALNERIDDRRPPGAGSAEVHRVDIPVGERAIQFAGRYRNIRAGACGVRATRWPLGSLVRYRAAEFYGKPAAQRLLRWGNGKN